MHRTGSYIYTVIERLRSFLDEADVDAKYSDDYIVRHTITPAHVDVLSRLLNTHSSPIRLGFRIALSDDENRYDLPPCIQRVTRLWFLGSDDEKIGESIPRSEYHADGPGWCLEGNPGAMYLKITDASSVAASATVLLEYISNGDVLPHYGSGQLTTASGISTLKLAAVPLVGALDRRPSAYVGQALRLLPDTGIIQERQIVRHWYDNSDPALPAWRVQTQTPFSPPSDGAVTYEIAPPGSQSLYEAIAVRASMKLGARRLSERQASALRAEYLSALKTVTDNLTSIQGRTPDRFEPDTEDARRNPFR